MSKIKVKYSVEGEGFHTIKVDRNYTVLDFLDDVRDRQDNPDINSVYLKGRKLDEDELLVNYLDDSGTDVLIVSDDPDKGPDDFPHIDVADKTEKKEKIDEVLETTKKDAGDADDTTFKVKNDFKIFTTATKDSLLSGDKLTFKLTDNYETISEKIKDLIRGWSVPDMPDEFEVHIFLPGGLPFLPGDDPTETTLEQYYDVTDIYHHRLYVVVTKELGDFVEQDIAEPCNCSRKYKDMLSPLFESTTAGLTQMASLLGYFAHDGINGEHLMLVFAKITRFAPLVVNLFRILEHAELNILNIISITAPLFTLFKSVLPVEIENDHVLEYTLRVISFIGLIKDTEYLALKTVDYEDDIVDGEDDFCPYLRSTKQQHHVIIWQEDTDSPGFKGFNIDRPGDDMLVNEDQTIFEAVKTYKPVAPLSLHYIHYPTFINGDKDNEVLLFINEVADKKDWINYIDPKDGKVSQSSIDDLAKKVHNSEEENYLSLIDGNLVDQIIVICFDESMSMKWKLEGGNARHGEPSRAQIATEFLQALVAQSFALRVSSVYGLISFGNSVKVLQELTAMSSKFIDCLKKIQPAGKTLLYDALKKAQDMITEIVTPPNDEEEEGDEDLPYPNAKLRIIVISDGVDNKSAASPVALANSFIERGIVVDTVLVSTVDKNNEMCALSKLTGGLCFQPKSKEEGLKIFEQEAFLNIKMRHQLPAHKGKITPSVLEEEAGKFKKFDKEAENQDLLKAKVPIKLAVPLYMSYLYKSERKIETIRLRRALRELNIIGHHPSEDYKVYSSYATPAEWRIFIKGPKGTVYANKWLSCFMTLPGSFPTQPPSFRFITIPFHPNVSQEGTVMFSLVDKKYTPNTGIDTIIEGIVKLLKTPEENTSINNEANELYNTDKDEFKDRQKEGDTGKDDYKQYLKGVEVFDEIPEGEDVEEDERMSQMYVTNVYGKTRGKVIPTDNPDDLYD